MTYQSKGFSWQLSDLHFRTLFILFFVFEFLFHSVKIVFYLHSILFQKTYSIRPFFSSSLATLFSKNDIRGLSQAPKCNITQYGLLINRQDSNLFYRLDFFIGYGSVWYWAVLGCLYIGSNVFPASGHTLLVATLNNNNKAITNWFECFICCGKGDGREKKKDVWLCLCLLEEVQERISFGKCFPGGAV